MRNRAFELFSGGFLNQLKISPSTKVFLESSSENAVQLVNSCNSSCNPVYYIFVIPCAIDGYIFFNL